MKCFVVFARCVPNTFARGCSTHTPPEFCCCLARGLTKRAMRRRQAGDQAPWRQRRRLAGGASPARGRENAMEPSNARRRRSALSRSHNATMWTGDSDPSRRSMARRLAIEAPTPRSTATCVDRTRNAGDVTPRPVGTATLPHRAASVANACTANCPGAAPTPHQRRRGGQCSSGPANHGHTAVRTKTIVTSTGSTSAWLCQCTVRRALPPSGQVARWVPPICIHGPQHPTLGPHANNKFRGREVEPRPARRKHTATHIAQRYACVRVRLQHAAAQTRLRFFRRPLPGIC